MTRWVKALIGTGGATLAFAGFAGFLHTTAGRPVLLKLGQAVGYTCPLGYDRAPTLEAREAGRARFAQAHSGTTKAAARPALGFLLNKTTKGDIVSWAKQHGIDCKEGKRYGLTCEHIPAAAFTAPANDLAVSSLWLTFGPGDRLVALVDVRNSDATQVTKGFLETESVLAKVGPIAKRDGEASATALSAGLLRYASVEYRCSDYYALARASNMGEGRFILTEEFRALD